MNVVPAGPVKKMFFPLKAASIICLCSGGKKREAWLEISVIGDLPEPSVALCAGAGGGRLLGRGGEGVMACSLDLLIEVVTGGVACSFTKAEVCGKGTARVCVNCEGCE
jgi:hypothetical protein